MLLALRHNHGAHYDLIGQGIFINVRESYFKSDLMSSEGCAALESSFTVKDKLALLGQDLTDEFAKIRCQGVLSSFDHSPGC